MPSELYVIIVVFLVFVCSEMPPDAQSRLFRLVFIARQELGDVLAEVQQFAHDRRADALQARLGHEQQGLHARETAVDVGLLALVLKVLGRAHALDDIPGLLAAGQVDGEVAVLPHGDARFVAVEPCDGSRALVGRQHAVLALVDAHPDDQAVEERQGTAHDGVVPGGEGVEGPHK